MGIGVRTAPDVGTPAGFLLAYLPTQGCPGLWWVGFSPSTAYLSKASPQAADLKRRIFITKVVTMAPGKKAEDENEELQVGGSETRPVENEVTRIDDVPDRLLILANRLQRALDKRQATKTITKASRRKH